MRYLLGSERKKGGRKRAGKVVLLAVHPVNTCVHHPPLAGVSHVSHTLTLVILASIVTQRLDSLPPAPRHPQSASSARAGLTPL